MIPTKKIKSHFIAGISTAFILLLLFGLFTLEFSGTGSSALNTSEDDNLLIQLEDLSFEDIPLLPSGKDPLSQQKDNASESLSENKGALKLHPTIPSETSATPSDEETETIVSPDTLIKKREEVHLLKVDTMTIAREDSAVISEMQKIIKPKKRNNSVADRNRTEREKYQFYKNNYKNIRNFKKVYPYALKTKELIDSLNHQLSIMTNESEKIALIKETEKKLFKEYENAVRNMTISQGKLLLKLIARETNKTGYEIIKNYKGAFPASFWYSVGKLFGTDLKTEYHKEREDSLIENILDKYNKKDLY